MELYIEHYTVHFELCRHWVILEPMPAPRKRPYVFTLNNYTDEEIQELIETAQVHSEKCIIGKEVAPSTGTKHLQGYIYWKNAKTMEASRNMLPKRVGFHEVANGSHDDNYIYCSKEEILFLKNMTKPKPREPRRPPRPFDRKNPFNKWEWHDDLKKWILHYEGEEPKSWEIHDDDSDYYHYDTEEDE